ncbi:site-specific DNA-methyltransferase [Hornefia butyriciproducens]|uniref:site-specific DNA-methyltransferase n=1 Tax=Hornefia butyriciproducens TaxID=2652293 RepID=UPI003F89E8F2
MDKMRMESVDMTAQNIEKIGALFPNCITETVDENGKPKKAINFELLKQMLSCDVLEGDEAYEFTWVGKKAAIVEANKPIRKTLRPCKDQSVNWDNTENLYIEGDNLEVLKMLQESYLGAIKMIYIDPPYNTGTDFIYKDDFAQSVNEYEADLGSVDEDGTRMFKNTDSNGRFHSDWCSMMYSRLMLARNLLKEDGVLFISIDDNEVDNLRKICGEIFGESNFIADLIWQKKFSRSNDATYFSTMHDHILCYCKKNILNSADGWKIGLLPRGDEIPSGYSNPDNDPRGVWTSVILSAKSGANSLLYEITTPSGRKVSPPSGRYWSCSKETFEKWKDDGRIWFGAKGDGTPRKKTFLSEVQAGLRPNTILFHEDAGHNQEAKQETKALFDGVGVFDGPKPVRLLKLLMTIANIEDGDTVLDFFSGSATTAHAAMEYEIEKQIKCNYILVQLPEIISEESEAYKAGYRNICEVGEDRIRRSAQKLSSDNEDAAFDRGFRVLKIDDSNMNDVYYSADDYSQGMLAMLESNVKSDRNDLDLLFGCLLEWGLPLSLPYSSEQIDGCTVHNYNDGDLIACFDENVPDSVIKEIAKRQPLRAVFRDSSFANSPSKINVGEIFKLMAPDTRVKVI